MSEDLDELLAQHCFSVCDGCLCELDAGHEGLHVCNDPHHQPNYWTDHDAARWKAAGYP